MAKITGAQILDAVGGSVVRGDQLDIAISRLSEPKDSDAHSVSFLISTAFVKDSASCHSSVLVVQESLWESVSKLIPADVALVIKSPDAYLGLAKVTELYVAQEPLLDWSWETSLDGITQDSQSGAFIHPTAKVDTSAKIAPGAVVCAHAVVGPRTVVMPHAVLGPSVTIGAQCTIFPGVVLYPKTALGDRVRLHANVVLGADGFGYARGPRGSVKIWHLGRVIVGNDVEIGANTCIDRGTLRDTIIEDGVKVDNLVQVGHNGHLKAHSILCAQTGLAGNVTVGRGTILAGQTGVADKVFIGDGSVIGAQAGVAKDVPAGVTMLGALICKPRKEWWRLHAFFDRLPELFERVKKLENQ